MSKFVVNLTWDDVPHLTEQAKKEMLAGCSPHERDARSKGIPQLGAGAIYPIVEDDVVIEPFSIPVTWPRAAGMDVGWKKTACIWGAYDPKSDTLYLYSEYYRGYAEPAVHADAISARGRWVPIAVDCHSDRHSEAGGTALLNIYDKYGLNICKANNGPGTFETSLLEVYQRLSSGRLKIMSHLLNTLGEFRVYRRNPDGRIPEQPDHLMDAMRYLVMSFQQIMDVAPPEFAEDGEQIVNRPRTGRNGICGY